MRTTDEVCEAISHMTPEEQGHLIRRIRAMPGWSEQRKNTTTKLVMCLGMINGDRNAKVRRT